MIVLLMSLLAISFAQSTYAKQYRVDYTYNNETDAFYKLHLDINYYTVAISICASEGSALVVLSSEEEMTYVHDMVFKQNPDIGDYVWIGKAAINHKSAEIEHVIMPTDYPHINIPPFELGRMSSLGTGSVMTRGRRLESLHILRYIPFVCKINAKDVVYDPQCDTYIKGYEYSEDVGSCYKIPRISYKWNEAYNECRAQGAHLVVLNSELEHKVVRDILFKIKLAVNVRSSFFFLAGIRAEENEDGSQGVFKTIFNQTLAEAGFDQWSDNEPNNADNNEFCGSIFKSDGKYTDVFCTNHHWFICEKNVNK